MKTNARKALARIGVASLVVILLGGTAGATETVIVPGFSIGSKTALVPGVSIRSGDWVAVDGLGVVLLGSTLPSRFIAGVVRGELGIGGASAGVGLATNLLAGPCPPNRDCNITELLFNGMLSLEARVARMYGPTSWRSTTYVGGQLSLSLVIWKPSLGWMVDPRDPRDNRFQIATGGGW